MNILKRVLLILATVALYTNMSVSQASIFKVDTIDFTADGTTAGLLLSSASPNLGSAWFHNFEFPPVPRNRLLSATLTVVGSGVDADEIGMYFNNIGLGTMTATAVNNTTIFDLSTSWLTTNNLTVAFNWLQEEGTALIESSTLTVEVPEPATISLMLIALLSMIYLMKRRSMRQN